MKIYLSYSLTGSEHYILSILSKRLQDLGHVITTTYNRGFTSENLSSSNFAGSDLFIGLITKQGNDNRIVCDEWNMAKAINLPTLLLVEQGWKISGKMALEQNIIIFNRHNPEKSFHDIRSRVEKSKITRDINNNQAAWIIGGAALLLLIGLLANDE